MRPKGGTKATPAQAFTVLPSAATLSAWCDLVGALHTELTGPAAATPSRPTDADASAAARADALVPLCLWLLGCFAQAQAHELQHGLRPWPAGPPGTTQ